MLSADHSRDLTPFGMGSYTAQSLHAIGQVAQLVERGPEKAGVGGSIPSLATIFSSTYALVITRTRSNAFQKPNWRRGLSCL